MQCLTLVVLALFLGAALADNSCTCTCSTAPGAGSCSSLQTVCTAAGGSLTTCTDGSTTSVTCNGVSSCPSLSDCQTVCSVVSCSGTGTAESSCSSSKCFPANATVQLEDGSTKTMTQLKKGDRVLVGDNSFSDIYMFSHQDPTAESDFVQITTANHAVTLTADHYLYVNNKLAVAKSVRVGDSIISASGSAATVVKVAVVRGTGLYNPHTLHGDIVVNGVKTSIYTSAIAPALAHAALFPVRLAYQMGGDLIGDAFAQGSDLIANALPDGKETY